MAVTQFEKNGDMIAPSVLVIRNGIVRDRILDWFYDNKIKYQWSSEINENNVYFEGALTALQLVVVKSIYAKAYEDQEVIDYQYELDSENLEITKGKCMGCDEIVEFKFVPIKSQFDIEDVAQCPECGMLYSNTAFVDPSEIEEVE